MSEKKDRCLYGRYMRLYYRCYRPGAEGYEKYGALGITMCDEWLGDDGCNNFCEWAKNNGFSKELRLHRYNEEIGFSPNNCYWGTTMKIKPGNKYGRLTVIKPIREYKNKKGNLIDYYFECLCDCGNSVEALGSNVKRGNIKSCGCYQKEILHHPTHNETHTQLYRHFISMRQRCNPKNKDKKLYKSWAGRGIKVCKEWDDKNAYPIFRDWALKNGYKDGLSLERIDVDGDYCPENCTWIPRGEQQYNKTCTVWIGDKPLAKLARENGVKPGVALSRYKAGWDIDEILNRKPRKRTNGKKRKKINTD